MTWQVASGVFQKFTPAKAKFHGIVTKSRSFQKGKGLILVVVASIQIP